MGRGTCRLASEMSVKKDQALAIRLCLIDLSESEILNSKDSGQVQQGPILDWTTSSTSSTSWAESYWNVVGIHQAFCSIQELGSFVIWSLSIDKIVNSTLHTSPIFEVLHLSNIRRKVKECEPGQCFPVNRWVEGMYSSYWPGLDFARMTIVQQKWRDRGVQNAYCPEQLAYVYFIWCAGSLLLREVGRVFQDQSTMHSNSLLALPQSETGCCIQWGKI